ncbi:tRNA(Thr) (cytosine(32)-N(3))-methyltransferase [Saccharomycopsis crataegensis]|uniref:tRNA(Thr) (Cytosine(32)-N(3))-methyltransferase n=1 Tax=Saccharomycopsis crataegensis TaxID=43959 RepID=A0AAV5QRD0_9ASCO|nr:tRNA(Thr) (cytosine(32)-N(3))-methyltransferase [Saccharomycopsis crataegensis]
MTVPEPLESSVPPSSPEIKKPSLESRITGEISESDTRIGKDSPFVFGQRYLTQEEDVFSRNAWDHVEWGEKEIKHAEEMIAKQYNDPVSQEDKERYNATPEKFWNVFYTNHKENFFKDRNWLQIEFPLLYEVSSKDYGDKPVKILEVGCGAGNTMFPVLRQNQNSNLKIIGADYSSVAVDLIKKSESFDPEHAEAYVWDLANENGDLPGNMEPNSLDIVVMIFVFSALAPNQWNAAIKNISKLLKPGGTLLFRDYGRYDLAQVRVKKGRLLEDNFYIRGDGTRVYFFTEEELREMFINQIGFEEKRIATDRRLLVNRKKQLKMHRIWLQAVFNRPSENDTVETNNSSLSTQELMKKLALDDSDDEEDDGCTPPITCGCESCATGHSH